MNVINTQTDAIKFLRGGSNGEEIIQRLDLLPNLINFDPSSDSDTNITVTSVESEDEQEEYQSFDDVFGEDDSDDLRPYSSEPTLDEIDL